MFDKLRKLWRGTQVLVTFILLANAEDSLAQPNHTSQPGKILNAAFLCAEQVYNSELMAPYDILQHSVFRDSQNYVRCFTVNFDGKPFTTFEGIRVIPDYSFADAPKADILIIPSTGNSMTADLEDEVYMGYVRKAVAEASWVITVCDGAFPLAATGVLDGRTATTFPADREQFAKQFPAVNVRDDVNFVVDGKYITSVGGALSYEPALYLMEVIYSKKNAKRIAQGLVLDWDLTKIPHFIVPDRVSGIR